MYHQTLSLSITEHEPVGIRWVPRLGAVLKHPSSTFYSLLMKFTGFCGGLSEGDFPSTKLDRELTDKSGATFLVLEWLKILDPSWSHIFTKISVVLTMRIYPFIPLLVWSFFGSNSSSFLVYFFLLVNPQHPYVFGQIALVLPIQSHFSEFIPILVGWFAHEKLWFSIV